MLYEFANFLCYWVAFWEFEYKKFADSLQIKINGFKCSAHNLMTSYYYFN